MYAKPLVIDADAINILANRIKNIGDDRISMRIIANRCWKILPENAVLTPHPMGLMNVDIDIDDISDNIIDIQINVL